MSVVLLLVSSVFVACSIQSVYVSKEIASSRVEEIADHDIAHSVFLIGDAGEPSLVGQEPVLAALESEATVCKAQKTVIFLGDNIYESGMPPKGDPERAGAEEKLL